MDYFFALALTHLCERSLVSPDRPLRCILVVNPTAGGFVIKSKWDDSIQILKKYMEKTQDNPKRQIHKTVILNLTEGKGSARDITKVFIDKAEKEPFPFYLIISAGGDGTHCEVMQAVYNSSAHVRSNMAVLRLPMGTGNDNADSTSMEETLDLLINPVQAVFSPAVQLFTAQNGTSSQKGPFLAFNILSVGLDAYVTHMTNNMKEKKSSNYNHWLNIASFFYGCKYKIDFFNVRALDDKNNEIRSFNEKLLLLAMGASGNRTYGSQQRILPDDRNVCGIKQMPIFRKMAIKKQVTKGEHLDNSEVISLNAHRLEFSCRYPILAQMDGETVLLQPDDFPAVMELTAPVIPLLKKI